MTSPTSPPRRPEGLSVRAGSISSEIASLEGYVGNIESRLTELSDKLEAVLRPIAVGENCDAVKVIGENEATPQSLMATRLMNLSKRLQVEQELIVGLIDRIDC